MEPVTQQNTLIDKIGFWANEVFKGVIELQRIKQPVPTTSAPTSGNIPLGGSIVGGMSLAQFVVVGAVIVIVGVAIARR